MHKHVLSKLPQSLETPCFVMLHRILIKQNQILGYAFKKDWITFKKYTNSDIFSIEFK